MKRLSVFIIMIALSLPLCSSAAPQKIVSLNGAVSEILSGLGFEKNIIGTDITSNYPASLKRKPKLGHNKNISAEGIISLQPDVVTAVASDLKPSLVAQLKAAGIKTILFDQEFSVAGTKKLISDVAAAFGQTAKGQAMIAKLEKQMVLASKSLPANKPKVLFIYARGAGTMMVAGEGTPMEQIINLAGGQNTAKGFREYKPLTPEALIAANPDYILLFDTGLESLGGAKGLLQVQGVKLTNAGKNKNFITMEGQLLTGFGPRLGDAVLQLARKLR